MPDQFKADIVAIMADLDPLELVLVDAPASRGWLRRPAYDVGGIQAWEQPDGTIVGAVATQRAAPPAAEHLRAVPANGKFGAD